MLQFATYESSCYSVKEQVETALEVGCRWIRLTGKPDDADVKELIPPCQESDAILVLDNNLELVDKLRIHGLHLTDWTRGQVIEAREKLGPHAILGVTCRESTLIRELSGLDVDYMVIPAPTGCIQEDFYIPFIKGLKECGSEIHPVASGNIQIASFQSILATGIEGIEISGKVLDAPDPMSFLNLAIRSLK